MKKTISQLVADKRVLILGYGREGRSSYNFIEQVGGFQCLDIADAKEQSVVVDDRHSVVFGDSYLDCLDDYDVVFKSPGIVLPRPIDQYSCYITCQADLFLQVYGQQTIGITGTKGKSTTSSLLYHVLKECGKEVLFGGNIGIPIFELIGDITDNTTIVFELSCHQLEYAHFSPHRAIFLNLYEDHLDHYGSVEKYWNAKKNLYRNQKPGDLLYCNPDFLPADGDCQAEIIPVTADCLPFSSFEEIKGARLRGGHNLTNVAYVYQVCQDYNIGDESFEAAVASFTPLPHRLEFLGQLRGVDYYDDSISTTVESAISAIKAVPNAGTILLGGMDRGIDYDPLADFLVTTDLEYIVLMYDSGQVLQRKLKLRATPDFMDRVHYIGTLEEACDFVKENASTGTAVLLSPAAASYGVFKNFEERGDCYKQYIFGGNQ